MRSMFAKLLIAILGLRLVCCGSCPDSDLSCLGCTGTFCYYCVLSYPNERGVCVTPTKFVPDCYSYSRDGVCFQCALGFFKTPEGLCFAMNAKGSDHCYFSTVSVSSCSHCSGGTLSLNGKCPSTRKCADPNCYSCFWWGNAEACFDCNKGYFLVGKENKSAVCHQITPETDGCYFSTSTSLCIGCHIGYYFSNFRCLKTTITAMNVASTLSIWTSLILFSILQ